MTHSTYRGHAIIYRNGAWLYADTMQPTIAQKRPCGHCGLPDTPEGHDGCLGTLPAVLNACCGHGRAAEAYIQYADGSEVRGVDVAQHIQEPPR